MLTRIRRDTLVIPQGDNWGFGWPIYTRTQPRVLVNVAGWRIRSQIRLSPLVGDILFEWDSADSSKGRAVAEDGFAKLFLVPADSDPWDFDEAEFDIKGIRPDGYTQTLVRGDIQLQREITRYAS